MSLPTCTTVTPSSRSRAPVATIWSSGGRAEEGGWGHCIRLCVSAKCRNKDWPRPPGAVTPARPSLPAPAKPAEDDRSTSEPGIDAQRVLSVQGELKDRPRPPPPEDVNRLGQLFLCHCHGVPSRVHGQLECSRGRGYLYGGQGQSDRAPPAMGGSN